jgi:hypothetical protein
MPDVKYEKLILCDAIVNEIWISENWQAAVPRIVDDAADLRKEA